MRHVAILALLALFTPAAWAQAAGTPAPAPPSGRATPINQVHGSTAGLVESASEWGLGIQIGTRGSSGIVAQKMAFHDGALDFGFGFGGGVYSVYADYLMFLDKDFTIAALPEAGGYNQTRGRLMPFLGAGLMVARGVALHVPLGLQYTMLKDPFNFYGGAALVYGQIEDGDDLEFRLQGYAGARLLL